jgi:5'-3' exonuclease
MYKYLIFDGSYYVMKAFHALRSYNYKDIPLVDKTGNIQFYKDGDIITTYEYTFTKIDLARAVYYQIAKLIREHIPCKKPIIVFDKSPYHKLKELEDYKSDRHYYSEDDLAEIDEEKELKKWNETKEEIRIESIKREAKEWIKNNFNELGIPVLWHQGYEGDDLAYLLANQLELDGEKSAIVSIDGDWSYLINPNVDHIKLFMKKDPVIISYDEMRDRDPNIPEDMSLYRYKSIIDSLYGSHNFLQPTITADSTGDIDAKNLVLEVNSGNYSHLSDIDLFQRQLRSFNIDGYPELDIVKDKLRSINETLSPLTVDQYRIFCDLTGFDVNEGYYIRTIDGYDKSLYTEENRTYIS